MKISFVKAATAALLASAVPSVADAAVIVGLYNSGVTSGGAGWAAGGGATTGNGIDPHWTIAGGTAYNGGTNGTWPIGPWLAETTTSRWITPTANAADAVVSQVYRLTFDLTGFNAATASFSGRAATDDIGNLYLNGALLGPVGSYTSWTNIAATSGFVAGVNTLDIEVFNTGGGPSGARIEFLESSVDALTAAVPEPATWAMMVLGFTLVGGSLRRRQRVSVSFA